MRYLLIPILLFSSMFIYSEEFDFQGLWECQIDQNADHTEYVYIKKIDKSDFFITMCAPESHDNDGNFHALDFSAYGYLTKEKSLYVELENNNFTFEPFNTSIIELWNGYETDRIFSLSDLDYEKYFDIEYIDYETFHTILEKIKKEKRY